MKTITILSLFLTAQISHGQSMTNNPNSLVYPPPAIMPKTTKSKAKECFFCDHSIGSRNNPREISEISVVGKPTEEGLPSLYEPRDLVDIEPKYMTPLYRKNFTPEYISQGKMEKMRRNAYIFMVSMLNAAHRAKIDLFIHSAYRSYEVQCRVFSGKLVRQLSANRFISKQYTSRYALSEMNADIAAGYEPEFTREQLLQAITEVNTRSALPGQSEHQLGSAVDLVTMISKYEPKIPSDAKPLYSGYALEYEMQDTPAFKWLQQNAYKYGYALSYPQSETLDFTKPNSRTGYIYEPWHWRYIGVKYATRFKDCGGLVLREFLKEIYKNPDYQCNQSHSSTKRK
jgi:LAS superfamily LD-carboxypeptidase LdcB